MGADSYEVFRMLIRDYKNDELSYDKFCEIIDEFAVLSFDQERIVAGITKYIEALPSNNNSDVRILDFDEKSELSETIAKYVEDFLAGL
ncbi:hypothetical protein MCEMRE196_00479 [Candidatus Nanopelagicaceae bacterium]